MRVGISIGQMLCCAVRVGHTCWSSRTAWSTFFGPTIVLAARLSIRYLQSSHSQMRESDGDRVEYNHITSHPIMQCNSATLDSTSRHCDVMSLITRLIFMLIYVVLLFSSPVQNRARTMKKKEGRIQERKKERNVKYS